MTEKVPFIHTTRFNVWIVIAFFQAFVGALVITTVAAVHSLGVAAGEELSRYGNPAPRAVTPKPEPVPRPGLAVPVALSSPGAGR